MRVSDPKINREAIKTLVVQHGQREAARISGVNSNTVRSWCMRYGWKQAVPGSNHSQPICNQSPSDALATSIANDNVPTRAALSKAHRKAAEAAQKLPGDTLLNKDVSQALRHHGQGAALVHGWEAKQEKDQSQVAVNIAILNA
jgi:uncharacterized protein YjcR